MKGFVMFLTLVLTASLTHAKAYRYDPVNGFESAEEYKIYFDKAKALVDQAESKVQVSGFTTKGYPVKVSKSDMSGGCAFERQGSIYINPTCATAAEIESILVNDLLD